MDRIKLKIEAANPIAIRRRKKMRKRLKNLSPSFLTPNCIGGVLFHDLGLKFRSPTVNLMMNQRDFVKFVCHLEVYLSKELEFYEHPDFQFPCAHLGDLTIHFTHYKTQEDAERKWKERKERIDFDNLFIFAEERDGISKEEILRLQGVKAKGKVVFTAHKYDDIPYTLFVRPYQENGEIGNILRRNYLTDSREYEKYFDFVRWFNESDGGSCDSSPYALI